MAPGAKCIALLETWQEKEIKWKPNEDTQVFQIPAIRVQVKGRASGVVIIFVDNWCKPKQIAQDTYWIKLKLTIKEEKLWWIVAYLPPKMANNIHLKNFEEMILRLDNLNNWGSQRKNREV